MLSQNSGPEMGCGVEDAVWLLGDIIEAGRYSPHGEEFEMLVPEKE